MVSDPPAQERTYYVVKFRKFSLTEPIYARARELNEAQIERHFCSLAADLTAAEGWGRVGFISIEWVKSARPEWCSLKIEMYVRPDILT